MESFNELTPSTRDEVLNGQRVREKTLRETIEAERQKSRKHEELVITKNAEIAKLMDELETLREENAAAQNRLRAAKRRTMVASESTNHEIINYRMEIGSLKSQLAKRQSNFEQAEEEYRRRISVYEAGGDALQMASASEEDKENSHKSTGGIGHLHYKIGNLTATVSVLQEQLKQLKMEKTDLEHEIKSARDEVDSLRVSNILLEQQLAQNASTKQDMDSHVKKEIDKLKFDKGELRFEVFKLKRELESAKQKESDFSAVQTELDETKEKLTAATEQLAATEAKLADAERRTMEVEAAEQGKIETLSKDLLAAKNLTEMQKGELAVLEKQCDEFLERIRREVSLKQSARKRISELENELLESRSSANVHELTAGEVPLLRDDNDRLLGQIAHLEMELREAHTAHREELALLAKQKSASEGALLMDSNLRKKDSEIQFLTRSLEQTKGDVKALLKTQSDLQGKLTKQGAENMELRKVFNDSIIKLKALAETKEELTHERDEKNKQLEAMKESVTNLEEQIAKLHDELLQKDENIAYLHAIVQPRKLEKLKTANSTSTLLVSAEEEGLDMDELISKRDELARVVAERREILKQRVESGSTSSMESGSTATATQPRVVGVMRHNIPHRWTKTFLLVSAARCSGCQEVLTRFTYALRCKECHVCSHAHCRSAVTNTCGLPSACAHYYVGQQMATETSLQSWVRVTRVDANCEEAERRWERVFAVLTGDLVTFFKSDAAFMHGDSAISQVHLGQERWKLCKLNGRTDLAATPNEADLVLEVKMPEYSMVLVMPDQQTKAEWANALQNATNRRILERHSSQARVMSISTVIRIAEPKLKVQSTEFFHDWLLMGTPQGLFVTNVNEPRMPYQIAGCSYLFQMKFIPEANVLFAIEGRERHVVLIRAEELEEALAASTSPRVSTFKYQNIPAAHLIEVSHRSHSQERYAYVGTSEGITVLRYSLKHDMFTCVKDIVVDDTVTCITSVKGGFVFGSDSFYRIDIGDWLPMPFHNDWVADVPIGIVSMGEDELLLVTHNYGHFTTTRGVRTRPGFIEWPRVPVSVHALDSYLLVVYTDITAVVRVLPTSQTEEDGALVKELDGYQSPGARITGCGRQPNELILSVMNDSCIELNICCTSSGSLRRKKTSLESVHK